MEFFLRKTKEVLKDLVYLGPFVTYGSVDPWDVHELIHRRGSTEAEIDGEKKQLPLSDNRIIEDKLGDYNVICLEDLIDEIVNVGLNFDRCLKFLAPFKVQGPEEKKWVTCKPFS